jgi:hypothetical protein
MPASYRIHPVINIANLEKYQLSPPELSDHPLKTLNQEDFNMLPEYEVEKILSQRSKQGQEDFSIPNSFQRIFRGI